MTIRKIFCIYVCMLLAGMMAGCGKNSAADSSAADSSAVDGSEAGGIDIDLTALSSTMVYSEVYNMMYAPEEYIGKTVKMDGLFSVYQDQSTGNNYFACVIQDAAACCAQGIEFQLSDDYVYPEDYPEVGDSVSVIGVFDTYQEGDYRYCTLRNARLTG